MPVYVYRCRCCGTDHDLFRSIGRRHDEALCPECEEGMELVITCTPAVKVSENIFDRVNNNYKKRQARIASGESLIKPKKGRR